MKKVVIIFLGIICWFSYSNGTVKGVSWNMSKVEVKKALKTNNLGKETLDELSYRNIAITDSRLDLNRMADVVFFTFENDKLVSMKVVFRKSKDKNYVNDFVDIIVKCAMDEGSQQIPSETKIAIGNIKYNYACGLDETKDSLLLLLYIKANK